MVAGGTLLFIILLEIMRHGELRNLETGFQTTGIVPIAFPLIAGPGTITSVIISQQKDGLIVTLLSIIIVIRMTYVVLVINPIYRILANRIRSNFQNICSYINSYCDSIYSRGIKEYYSKMILF